MPVTKTAKEVEMGNRLDILRQALQQVCKERTEANREMANWKHTAQYYLNRYHKMRVELAKRILDLKDASAMIDALLSQGKTDMPDIDITDDLDIV